MEQYTAVERQFFSRTASDEEVILRLRDQNKDNIFKAIQTIFSHNNISAKNNLIIAILDEYRLTSSNAWGVAKYFFPAARKLTELHMSEVSLKAREVLIQCALPSVKERVVQMEHILQSSVVVGSRYIETEWEHREPDLEVLK